MACVGKADLSPWFRPFFLHIETVYSKYISDQMRHPVSLSNSFCGSFTQGAPEGGEEALADPMDAQEWVVNFLDDLLERVDVSIDRARHAIDSLARPSQVSPLVRICHIPCGVSPCHLNWPRAAMGQMRGREMERGGNKRHRENGRGGLMTCEETHYGCL